MAEEKNKAAGANGATALTPEQEIEKLKADLASAQADSAKKDAALEASKKIIGEQAEALATKEVQLASKNPVVMVDKTHYEFLGKGNIIIDGKSIPAKEVMENQGYLKQLIKIGSGLIKEAKVKKGGK
ncbi:MAG: hypothetical protein ACK4SF_04495 [Algoriphagus aquaeductus]|uniref:hypothetical protein n=1 Tax=Algoriphagus aquaeductus TaxID=475299 RepID=UPI00391C0C06